MTTTTNSRESLQLALETARKSRLKLETQRSVLIDRYLVEPARKGSDEVFTIKDNRIRAQIHNLDEEIARCRESLNALPSS